MTRVRKSSKKLDTYQICVTVIEAKHLEQNGSPMVVVRVGNRKKKTAVCKTTDNPYYNEYFVFDLTCSMDTLLSTRLELAVYLCGRLKRSKFHGNIVFEVATVWDQPDHQYHHKWAMLTNPRDLTSGPRGYVKCNIAVHAKGEKFKMPPETDGDDDIEGNLLLPLGDSKYFATRQRARYVFTLHRVEDMADAEGRLCYISLSFAGLKSSTSSDAGGNPRFDERLVFKEMFPPLCHRARISIKCRKSSSGCCRNNTIASYLLNLKSISNSGEYGFLPTFGPSFLHLYANAANLTGAIYRGRLLLSLKTEIDRSEAASSGAVGVHLETAASIVEDSLWRLDEYLLVGVFYDCCMIDRSLLASGKSASLELSLGNAGNLSYSDHQLRVCDEEAQENDDKSSAEEETTYGATGCASPDSQSETLAQIVTSIDLKYNCLEFGVKKPCVFVKSWWPNTEWRARNTNRLTFIADNLERELERLETLVTLGHEAAHSAYNSAIRGLQQHCASYLHSLRSLAMGCARPDDNGEDVVSCMTSLDRHRLNYCRREIEGVMQKVKVNGELGDNGLIRIAMVHARNHLRIIRSLCKDPQHTLPDIFLWLLSNSRRLGYTRLPASRVLYAEERPERGRNCGQRLNLFLETRDSSAVVCQTELFLWLGNAKFAGACWSALPPGYRLEDETLGGGRLDVFPKFLEYEKSSVIKQTLDPFWDQTLVFPAIDVHGMREHVKNHPPKVVLEAFDRDYCNSLELYGRCVARPLVKLDTETHSPPDFPPKLRWHRFGHDDDNGNDDRRPAADDSGAAVLAAFELVEVCDKDHALDTPDLVSSSPRVYRVPEEIRPKMATYRIEVVFWGVRDMRRLNLVPVHRPKIAVECAGVHVESEVMENAKRFANFQEMRVSVDLEMSTEEMYYPPITIKAYDSRGFGCFKYAGMCCIPTIYVFMQRLITKSEYESAIYHSSRKSRPAVQQHTAVAIEPDYKKTPDDQEEEAIALMSYKKLSRQQRCTASSGTAGQLLGRLLRLRRTTKRAAATAALDRDESHDWWSKYYASLEEEKSHERGSVPSHTKRLATFKVYAAELEAQPEFSGFQDRLRSFELRRGKKVVGGAGDPWLDDENNYAGKFKGNVAVYRWPHPEGLACVNRSGRSASHGLLDDYPSQEQQMLIVRLYVVKAINLRPCDPLSGKADPYLKVKLGKNSIDDRKKYIPNQLNPTFGRVIELEASFPKDHTLTIQVWDYDATSSDDLIGETRVDVETRFYSQHRAQCGLAKHYDVTGYNAWRDREKPCQILRQLCRRYNLPLPEYWDDYVRIGRRKFYCERDPEDGVDREERMALSVLHRWSEFPICGCVLVPEHVERRPLFNPKRPGLEQGRLEMWIDMFGIDELPTKPAVDISPQEPEDYELRVTVWNTEDVPLVDSQFLTGEKCSDIYVKGWILAEDNQRTDVHYNSLTGEGNFNWRFVFRFTWARGERMMIVSRKASVFARDETEQKMPCKLTLQVWDSDHFSKDDFLGELTLYLANMPKGSHSSRNCYLRLLIDSQSPRMSLFRAQRTRGWWPLSISTAAGQYAPAGKIELEMSLLPASEADKQPVGKGREPPEALPPPDRPDTSFSWFRNPWKAFCFVVCRYYRWRILGCCCCMLLVLLVGCAVYAFPGYLVKRILGA
ncbi:otoferlin isoform X4 [Nasonia vitripennis]|uniref:C2 domain-containing protein n=1 Tax=Nasonia vitripennis TaxID=7425 RepID=A0A7M7QBZ8_NASVI|nr:otoferlin isoform X4 [Nasonia vitripennis]